MSVSCQSLKEYSVDVATDVSSTVSSMFSSSYSNHENVILGSTHLISSHLTFSHVFQTTDLFAMIEKMQVMCFHFSYFPSTSHISFFLLVEYIRRCFRTVWLHLMFFFAKGPALANKAIRQQMISLQEQISRFLWRSDTQRSCCCVHRQKWNTDYEESF